ncbi:hypothetical protein EVB97_057 [Rhizobium phage RHph_Y65]|uniref:Uncharacterized protein n=1 Tax=Rhizobium phage RHph_Y65 TaxID=2509785 RepID=A0A7S5UVT9_9CAUD|nr:hypothetical protein PQC17_gp057 [Rhizobium phage RHph_Y65]QIG71893.1 hypothetical protein EVB95_059 [Rhizobium phage RHph_TM2_3B]QIG72615.1 hypothetical protein EVB97_057 [Rhizobium phage RHph_Y65]
MDRRLFLTSLASTLLLSSSPAFSILENNMVEVPELRKLRYRQIINRIRDAILTSYLDTEEESDKTQKRKYIASYATNFLNYYKDNRIIHNYGALVYNTVQYGTFTPMSEETVVSICVELVKDVKVYMIFAPYYVERDPDLVLAEQYTSTQ